MRTGPSRSAVSNLDFELRKVRESQNSPGGVIAKAITPQPQLVNTLSSSDQFCFMKFSLIYMIELVTVMFIFELVYLLEW